jgi:ubiquinone/menaquinone biosynthesis C-methylase UbiE
MTGHLRTVSPQKGDLAMTTASYRNFTGTAAENYQRYFVPAIATPVSVGLLDAAGLHTGDRVLDVACGTGVIARLAAERVGSRGSVTAIDIAPDMISVAKSTESPAARIEWHVGDAAALPLGDTSYDVVLCQMGLMFMEDRAAALAEMRRVVVPGGRVVVNTPGTIQPAFVAMEQAIVEHISPDLGGFVRAVFSMHDPEALATLLRDSGLQDVSATVTTTTLELPRPDEFLWQYVNLTPMGPLVAAAPADARLAMERQVVDRWQPFVVNGRTLVAQPMVIASGRR